MKKNTTNNTNTTTNTTNTKRSEASRKGWETRKRKEAEAKRMEAEKKEEEARGKFAEERVKEAGGDTAEERTASLSVLIEEKRAEEKQERAEKKQERAIDRCPAPIREKVEALRAEFFAENKKREELLLNLREERGASFGNGERIDWFEARRASAFRVLEYVKAPVWKEALKEAFRPFIEKAEGDAERLRIEGYNAEEEEEKAEKLHGLLRDVMREECTFKFTSEEKASLKAYGEARTHTDRAEAVARFIEALTGLNLRGNTFIAEVLASAGYERGASSRAITGSGAREALRKAKASDIGSIIFGRLLRAMLKAGTIKPAYVPSELRAVCSERKKKH